MNLAVDESTDEFRYSWPVSEHGLGNKALDARGNILNHNTN